MLLKPKSYFFIIELHKFVKSCSSILFFEEKGNKGIFCKKSKLTLFSKKQLESPEFFDFKNFFII